MAARRDHKHGREAFATPAFTLGTGNSPGTTTTSIRSDAFIAVFDATAPATQAFADTPVVGTAAVASRRDHKHGMPANPATTNFNAGADQTASRAVNATVYTNGSRRRSVYVTVSLNASVTGSAAVSYTTTAGGTALTGIEAAKVATGLTQAVDFQFSFVVDPAATYSVANTLGTSASATLVSWIEIDW